jgi:hypothetical protein
MCTATWLRHPGDGFELFFNRDEKHTRMPASPPELRRDNDGTRFLAPRDPEHGGTWIAVNEFGVCVCLLNGSGTALSETPVSRGLLVHRLAGALSAKDVLHRAAAAKLDSFAPFVVLALDFETENAVSCEWSQGELHICDRAGPHLTSSSFDTAEVCRRRRLDFERHSQNLFEFHRSHDGPPSAYSTCMHRGDAATVSFSHIRVSARQVDFHYSPGPPCLGSFARCS